MKIRPASTRGYLNAGWIKSHRTFSNNSYWDPCYMNWGNLKVVNDDTLQPGHTVPNHEHINYDILGYIVEGQLQHADSLGNVQTATAGQIQHMWCGKSIWHSESNNGNVAARYLQIWITPKNEYCNTSPSYQIINKDSSFGVVPVQLKQNIAIQAGILSETITTCNSYLYVINGKCMIGDKELNEGDGAEIDGPVVIIPIADPHILLFENTV